MKKCLNTEEKKCFFARLHELNRGQRITLRRCVDRKYTSLRSERILFLSLLPEGKISDYDPTLLQNLLFVAAVFCIPDIPSSGDSADASKILADGLLSQASSSSGAAQRMEVILAYNASPVSNLYRSVGFVLQKAGKPVNCNRLLDDLQRWNDDEQVRQRWAMAFVEAAQKRKEII